jgi:hypothetical protein
MSYHMLIGIKFLLSIPIFFIAAFLSGRTAVAQKVQAKATTWMTVNLVLALIMVLLGGMLRFVLRVPKSDFQKPASHSQAADETLSLARATK